MILLRIAPLTRKTPFMRLKNRICVVWLLLLGLLAVPVNGWAAKLQGFSFETGQAVERITILTDAKLKQKQAFLLNNPDRLVLDFEKFEANQASLPENYRGKLIKSVRTGTYKKETTRIVFDLTVPVDIIASYHVEPVGSLWRYVMDIRKKPGVIANRVPAAIAPTEKVAAKKPEAQKSKPIIVLDPGHGGQDPGALGSLHKEKDITLRFAKALEQMLEASGEYEVLLTRDSDRFIALKQRVDFARAHKAALFISLHADSNPNEKAKGLSIYTLSETASDAESAALAARENKSDIIDGVDLGSADADVADILIDLTQRETMSTSAILADDLVRSLKGKIPLLPRPHRYAGFRVLKTLDIPAVLIEIGFLSNKEDEKRLASPQYRKLVAETLMKGIKRYLKGRKTAVNL